jgi:transcriptional regulator with XRE-family HTH domain
MNYLSTNIKYLRLSNKLTQDELSKIVGKSRVLISQWESDEREITTEDVIKLSDYFNIPMDKLVGNDLRFASDNKISQSEILFNKNKEYLTESDWNIINTIVEQRKKEIDKELGEEYD